MIIINLMILISNFSFFILLFIFIKRTNITNKSHAVLSLNHITLLIGIRITSSLLKRPYFKCTIVLQYVKCFFRNSQYLFIFNKPQRTQREKIIKKNRRFVLMTINTSKSGEKKNFCSIKSLSFPLIFLFLPSRFQGHFCREDYKYQEQYLFHQYSIRLRLGRT